MSFSRFPDASLTEIDSNSLSYYGGGHYDSLMDVNHAANRVQEVPGEWEQRRIEYSHRINTRGGVEPPDVSGQFEQQVQSESDRETTEMAQVEHILMVRLPLFILFCS